MTDSKYICIRDEQIQGMSRKIERIDAKVDYKDKRMAELMDKQTIIEEKIDSLTQLINDMKLKSVNDDTLLREHINELENRITQLETAQTTMYRLIMVVVALIPIIQILLDFK